MSHSRTDSSHQPVQTEKPLQFYRRDPVMVLLQDRLGLNTGRVVVGIALVALVITLGVPYILPADPNARANIEVAARACDITVENALQSHTFLKTLGSGLLESLGILPLAMLVYFMMPGLLADLFGSIHRNELIVVRPAASKSEEDEYARFLRSATNSIDSPVWAVLGAACVAGYWVFRLRLPCDYSSLMPTYFGWQNFYRILLLLVYSLPLYGGGVTIGRLGAGLVSTGYLFHRFDINVNPLHQDQAGGLGVVGRNLVGGILFAVILGLVAVGLGIIEAVINPYTANRPEVSILGIVYLVLTPLFFYFWLWAPHQALLRARKLALQPLADAFQQVFSKPMALDSTGPEAIKTRTQQMEEIKRQYDFVMDTFPTWPLPRPTVRNLVATASLPPLSSIAAVILPSLFPRMPDLLSKLLNLVK